MQTRLADFIKDTDDGREAEAILRKCVHCGFCTATCPTYQLLGDELDGPRGRIYLIKQMLEGAPVSARTQLHLDRCLTCRSCETTCPSGVEYGRLLDVGRAVVDAQVKRSWSSRVQRWGLRELLSRPGLFGAAMALGRWLRPALPRTLREKVLPARPAVAWPQPRHRRRMLVLAGCVQPAMMPSVNAATARVLDRLGISLVEAPGAGCCGAVRHHLDDTAGARADARRNIDAWWPLIESDGIEALVLTASACGLEVKDYAHLLRDDPQYREKAAQIAALTRDVAEVLAAESEALAAVLPGPPTAKKLAFHAPCTLQHGLRIKNAVESLLRAAGFELTSVADAHLCCGSAGTYAVLQPDLSGRLRARKLAALAAGGADAIASANVGCIAHLAGGTETPVRHWVEYLADRLEDAP